MHEQVAKAMREAVALLAWQMGITPYEAACYLAGIEPQEVE